MSKHMVWIALVIGIGLGTAACGNISRTPTAPTPAYSSGLAPGQGPLDAPQGVHGNGNGNHDNNGNNDGDHNNDGHPDNGQGNGGNNGDNGDDSDDSDDGDDGDSGDGGDGDSDTDPPNGPLQIAGLYDGVVTLGAGNVGCHSPIYFVVELTQNGAAVNASVLYGDVLLVWHGSIPNSGTTLNLEFTPGVNIPFRCNFTNYLASGASFTGEIAGDTITGTGFVSFSDNQHEVGVIYATAVLTKQ